MTPPTTELDDASAAVVDAAIRDGTKPVHEMTPDEARRYMEATLPAFDPQPLKQVRAIDATVGNNSVPVRVLEPYDAGSTVVVYFHGGGWVLGSAELFESFCSELANRSRSVVVVVDYGLAPEHRFPTAVDDCYDALCWTHEHLDDIAPNAHRIVVAGDSAGGNLAAVMAQRSLDRGGPDIALQALIYPVLDSDLDTRSYRDPALQLLLSRETMAWFWECYVPNADHRVDPEASPLRRNDLRGLPSALVLTAGHDVLRDEAYSYVERLQHSDVEVRHEHHPDQMHGFIVNPDLPGHDLALNQVCEAIAAVSATARQ